MKPQQFRRIVGAAAFDGFAVDDDRRGNHFAEWRLDTGGRDDDRVPRVYRCSTGETESASGASASAQAARRNRAAEQTNRKNVLSEENADMEKPTPCKARKGRDTPATWRGLGGTWRRQEERRSHKSCRSPSA